MTLAAQTANEPRVLVAYATGNGSTREVAERIATVLRARGNRVELRPVDQADGVGEYDALVVGSPVYNQRWLPAGEEFVKANLGALSTRPVWLFSLGSFGDRKRFLGPLVKREPRDIGDVRKAIHPRDYRVFAGVVERHQWPFLSRLFFRALGGRFGDSRDWQDIEAWAEGIAQALAVRARR